MKMHLKSAAAAAMFLACAASSQAALLYSFETGTDGFGPNGGGTTVTQVSAGATDGTKALQVSVVAGATFVGAITGNIPAALSSPLAVQQITFNYTLPAAFPGNFASLGITIFGASQPGPNQQFGLQAQFADFEALEGRAAGTYTATIDLLSATNQVDFSTNQSFNQIFGSGANQQIPTGFQFFLNKSGTDPITLQIDNVRLTVPEPTSMLALAGVGAVIARRRRIA